MPNLTLYEVAQEYREIAAALESLDLDEQTIADTLEGALFPVEQKSIAVASVMRNIGAVANAYKDHAKAAKDKADALQKRADWLKSYLLRTMEACGVKEISRDALTIKLKKCPASVEIYDEKQIPVAYMRQPETPPAEPDKKAMSDAMKAGEEIAGARLVQRNRIEIS
jgi:hypothetical protein